METLTTKINVDELACSASQLPPLRQSAARLLTLLGDPMCDIREVVKVISYDGALTLKLLQLANSSVYARSKPVSTVSEAVIRLGFRYVLAIAIHAGAQTPANVDLRAYGMTLRDYWRCSIFTVAAAEELTSRRIARFGSGFSTAALLHDFGKLILAQHMTAERLNELTAFLASHPGYGPVDAERAVLGIDHAVAGAMVCRHWNLPNDVVTAIENHHNPVNWEDTLTNGLILADWMAFDRDGQKEFVFAAVENMTEAMQSLGVTDADYELIATAAQARFDILAAAFR